MVDETKGGTDANRVSWRVYGERVMGAGPMVEMRGMETLVPEGATKPTRPKGGEWS